MAENPVVERALAVLDEICQDSLECPLSNLLEHREYQKTQATSALFLEIHDLLQSLGKQKLYVMCENSERCPAQWHYFRCPKGKE